MMTDHKGRGVALGRYFLISKDNPMLRYFLTPDTTQSAKGEFDMRLAVKVDAHWKNGKKDPHRQVEHPCWIYQTIRW
jgi:hypothetical protein